MLERALLFAVVALAIVAAASSVGGAISAQFAKLNPHAATCAAQAKDTCPDAR